MNASRWRLAIAAAVVALAGATIAAFALRGASRHSAAAGPTTPVAAPIASDSATVSPQSTGANNQTRTCTANQFVATVAGESTSNGERALIVALRSTANATCVLAGYPGLVVQAHPFAGGATTALPVTVQRGGVPGRADPGPKPLAVGPYGSVSFALGVRASAGAGTRYVITELRVSLPNDPAPVRAPISLTIGTSTVPVPVAITAFVAGTQGP